MFRIWAVLGLVAALVAGATPARATTFGITSPGSGETLSGPVLLTATVPDATEPVVFEWSRDGATWLHIGSDADGSDGWSVRWTTAPLDGPATVRATAGELTDAVDVVLVNAPLVSQSVSAPRFSPNADGRLETTTITVRVNEPARISLRVSDASGTLRWRTTSELADAGSVAFVWNGRYSTGARLADGVYTVAATAVDAVGNTTSATSRVVIDTIAPRVVWSGVSPDPSSGAVTERFSFSVRDADTSFRTSMRVRDNVVWITSKYFSLTSRTASVSWKPSRTLYPGTYRTVVRVVDRAGNVGPWASRAWRVHRSLTGRVIRSRSISTRAVALTFDDCHYTDAWRSILDTLRAKRVRATFFCPGQMLAYRPSLARRTVSDGHSVSSHGWDHANLQGRSDDFIRSRLLKDRAAWWRYGGATSAPYFRPPYGAYDARVVRISGELAMPRVMLWDVDTNDWRDPGVSVIVSRAVWQARPGSVILLHTKDQTARALSRIIDGLRSRNLRPVSLDELFRLS